jgi:hypothetical protein
VEAGRSKILTGDRDEAYAINRREIPRLRSAARSDEANEEEKTAPLRSE